jgi:hypothetical protein
MLQSVAANGHTFEECKEHLKNSRPTLHLYKTVLTGHPDRY